MRDGLQDLAAEDFVAGLHVGHVHVGEHVGEQSEEPVADGVPEIEDAVGRGAEEAGSVDDVGFAFEQRMEECGIVGGIVFEVGVLDDDEVSGGLLDAAAEGGALAHVLGLEQDADLGMGGLQFGEDFAGAVAGAVVDADEFDFERDGEDAGDDFPQRGLLVVDGHDYGEFHG